MSPASTHERVHPEALTVSPAAIDAGAGVLHEEVYRSASGDLARVPWAAGRANPAVVAWLNAEAPGRIRPGSRAVVVGSGLGDDVAALVERGYDACGFDAAPTAVDWARRRFPELAGQFQMGDVLDPPAKLRRRFELVVEAYTIQSLHPSQWERAAAGIASLCGPRGIVLVVARARAGGGAAESVQGPPWPLTLAEVEGLMRGAGLKALTPTGEFEDDETPPVRRIRGAFVPA
jgi:hypothetical protein